MEEHDQTWARTTMAREPLNNSSARRKPGGRLLLSLDSGFHRNMGPAAWSRITRRCGPGGRSPRSPAPRWPAAQGARLSPLGRARSAARTRSARTALRLRRRPPARSRAGWSPAGAGPPGPGPQRWRGILPLRTSQVMPPRGPGSAVGTRRESIPGGSGAAIHGVARSRQAHPGPRPGTWALLTTCK